MQIFISYAREDYDPAKRLFDTLKSVNELEPWLDKENLLPGAAWKEEILKVIDQSRYVILLLSDNSIEKEGFVQKEINEALDRFSRVPPGRLFLIPARLCDCIPKHKQLHDLNWVDLFDDFEEGTKRIITALTANKPTTTSFENYLHDIAVINPKAIPIIKSHPKGNEILKSMYLLRKQESFPRQMSIDGELVHNPIYEVLDSSSDSMTIGGALGPSLRIMLLELHLIKAYDKNGQPLILQYFSGTESAGWKTWLFPHSLGFQRNVLDISERMEVNARDLEITLGLQPKTVSTSYTPGAEFIVSVKPDFGYKHELVMYCFLFCNVTINTPPWILLNREYQVVRGDYARKFKWVYFEELQNDPDTLLKNGDVIKAVHTLYATSLVQIKDSLSSAVRITV